MAGKRGGAGRASPRAAKARRADDPAVAAARRAALDGELDETSALRLFLAGGDRGRCGRTCKGNPKRVDCVCGLVPPVDGFRRTGLWRRDTDALVREAVGVDPSTLARASRAVPVGLRNLGNTCYVNAAIQCVFAIPSIREGVLALDPGDDPSERSEPPRCAQGESPRRAAGADERALAVSSPANGAPKRSGAGEAASSSARGTEKNATAALRFLFASMVAGDRAVADPRRFADALSLETAAQQDGQEFLKLLLAYLDRVATRRGSAGARPRGGGEAKEADDDEKKSERLFCASECASDARARAGIAEHFRGQYTYATTCDRCGCASEASSNEVDFYELELNVSAAAERGAAAGRDAAVAAGADDDARENDGDDARFGLLDALRDFLAVERLEGDNQYKCARCGILTDATRAVKLRRLPRYLAFQLKRFVFDFETFERRKCADAFRFPGQVRMGDFVAERDAAASGDVAGTTGGNAQRYALQSILLHRGQNATSGHYVALVRAGDRGRTDATERNEKRKKGPPEVQPEAPPDASHDAWWRFDDEEVTALRGGPFGEPAVKGKDGRTLAPGSYASSDAYLLVYRRVDDEGTLQEDPDGEEAGRRASAAANDAAALPADLAAAVAAENDSLAAMVATFASRVEEARERVEARKARARRVAETARPPRVPWADDEPEEEDAASRARETDRGARCENAALGALGAYRFAPRAWLERFCGDTHDPGPMDLGPILCAHGAVDPNKAEATVRVSREAFEDLVAAAGAAGGEASPRDALAPGICRRCLRASAALVAGEDAEVTARAAARERLEAWESLQRARAREKRVSAMDDPADPGTDPGLRGSRDPKKDLPVAAISAAWLKKWRSWRRGPPPRALTKEGPTASITCAHGNLKPNANVATVDRETWSFLVQNPPADEAGASEAEPRVIEIDADDDAACQDGGDPGAAAARAGGGGGGGGGGCTARTASGAVPASNVEARRVEITGGTGPTPARSTAAADPSAGGSVPPEVESSLAPWPLHLASAEACAACVSARLEAAAAKSSTRKLAEIHRAACAALRDPLDPEAVRLEAEPGAVGEGAETEKPEPSETSRHETSASFRAFPRRWLARWRAFAFAKGASDSRASRTWRPSLSSLREAVDELFCPHGGLAAPCELYRPAALSSANRAGAADDRTLALAALEAERTRGLRAVFGDDVRVSNAEAGTIRDATCDDAPRLREPRTGRRENGTRTRPSVFELELVPASAAAALEEVLGGRARPPRCFADVRSGGSREWTFEPGVCVSCAHRAADPTERSFGEEETLASAPAPPPIPAYFSQPVSVRRVRTSPAAFARAFADRAKAIAAIGAKRARLDEPSKRTDGGTEPPTAPERSTARRGRVVAAGGEKWWEAPRPGASAKGGGGGAAANLPRLDPVGRACSLVVDHDYTAWRVKLLALEKLAIHPLDISLFYVTYGRDDAADGDGATSTAPVAVFELENAETLREAGVPPGATLALFATAQRDPDDLTGLEMPMGPVAWESDAGGGEGRDGAVGGASARERGFAGTALAGSQ